MCKSMPFSAYYVLIIHILKFFLSSYFVVHIVIMYVRSIARHPLTRIPPPPHLESAVICFMRQQTTCARLYLYRFVRIAPLPPTPPPSFPASCSSCTHLTINTIPSPPPPCTFPQLGHIYFEITYPSTAIKYDVAIYVAGYLIWKKRCTDSGSGLFYTPYV